jgi:hypothetical protein
MNLGLDLLQTEFKRIIHYMAAHGWTADDEKWLLNEIKKIEEEIKTKVSRREP